MKFRWLSFFLLAAFVGLLGHRVEAARGLDFRPSDLRPDAFASLAVAAPDAPVAADATNVWLVEAVYALGRADDGECIDLIVFVEPKTHTRVPCIVQSPLGLAVRAFDEDYRITEDGVAQVLVVKREAKWYQTQGIIGNWKRLTGEDSARWVDATPLQQRFWEARKAGRGSEAIAVGLSQHDFEGGLNEMLALMGASGAVGAGAAVAPVAIPAAMASIDSAMIQVYVKGSLAVEKAGAPLALAWRWFAGGKPNTYPRYEWKEFRQMFAGRPGLGRQDLGALRRFYEMHITQPERFFARRRVIDALAENSIKAPILPPLRDRLSYVHAAIHSDSSAFRVLHFASEAAINEVTPPPPSAVYFKGLAGELGARALHILRFGFGATPMLVGNSSTEHLGQ